MTNYAKPKFKLENFKEFNVAVRCKTKEELIKLNELCALHDLPTIPNELWDRYKSDTCVEIDDAQGYYSKLNFFINQCYMIYDLDETLEEFEKVI